MMENNFTQHESSVFFLFGSVNLLVEQFSEALGRFFRIGKCKVALLLAIDNVSEPRLCGDWSFLYHHKKTI